MCIVGIFFVFVCCCVWYILMCDCDDDVLCVCGVVWCGVVVDVDDVDGVWCGCDGVCVVMCGCDVLVDVDVGVVDS